MKITRLLLIALLLASAAPMLGQSRKYNEKCMRKHPSFTAFDCQRIEQHQFWPGMTAEMLLASQEGAPVKKQKLTKEEKKASRCLREYPGWTEQDCQRIQKHQVWVGMTYDMATASLGRPIAVNRTQMADHSTLQLVYLRPSFWAQFAAEYSHTLAPRIYLYIDSKDCGTDSSGGDCKVSSIQESN